MKSIVVYVAVCLIVLLSACTITEPVPVDGIWYCEDLQIMLDFGTVLNSYAVIDGERMICSYSNEKGTRIIDIALVDSVYGMFDYDKIIFSGYCDSWNEQRMLIRKWSDSKRGPEGEAYVFVRIG